MNPRWLAELHARANQAPARPRLPLCHGPEGIGSLDSQFVDQTMRLPPYLLNSLLYIKDHSGFDDLQIKGSLTDSLALIANALREHNLGGVARFWRNEQLAVHGDNGERLGTVERGVVRLLGIATQAVHLVGRTVDGRYWIQQRSLDKANDPGLLDTLMGGLVSAQDTVESALARETWEEAGLHTSALANLQFGGQVQVRRPTGENDWGYVVEDTTWYHCIVPDDQVPENQDGEVAQFLCLSADEVIARLHNDEFTLEAALVLVAAMNL